MSLVTAIRSVFTPNKYYQAKSVFIAKSLQKDGSTLVEAFDRNSGSLVKSIVKKPVDVLTYDPKNGNKLTTGHITTVKDAVKGTETTIRSMSTKYEKPVYSVVDPEKKVMDAGDSIYIFNKTKQKDGVSVDLFNLHDMKGKKECIKVNYDTKGKPLSVKEFVV